MNRNTEQIKTDTFWIGICFILAAIFSIIGLKMYEPILNPINYITTAYVYKNQIVFGAFCELILIVSMLWTSIYMYPYLIKNQSNMGIAYLSFRTFESIFIAIGLISILAALSISIAYSNEALQNLETLEMLGYSFKSIYKWCFMIGPNFMLAINTFIYNKVFFNEKMTPKYLSVWGMVASILLMLAFFLEMFGLIEQLSIFGILLAVPIALFEMTFAIWLLTKRKWNN